MFLDEDDDYDDFSDDLDEDTETSARTYVPLNAEPQETADENAEASFTPLTGQETETIEEFFDEEDSSDEEPPILDN